MNDLNIPEPLCNIETIRELISHLSTTKIAISLCWSIRSKDTTLPCKGEFAGHVGYCAKCILNYDTTPILSQGKETSIEFLLENGLITKGEALSLTLDIK